MRIRHEGILFIFGIHKRAREEETLFEVMDESPRYKGRWYYETHDVIIDSKGQSFGNKRLIAYWLPGVVKTAVKYLEQQGLKQAEELRKLWHQRSISARMRFILYSMHGQGRGANLGDSRGCAESGG